MGNTRDLIKKTGDTKGTFNTNRGTIQDRNGKDLTEEEEIKKRWQEYMEELFKNGLNDLDNHDGMVTHLEPDTVQCEVKWILGSITTSKASGSFGIPGELFKILKDDALKMLHSICQQIWKTTVATGLEKVSFHSNPQERQCQRMFKLPYHTITLFHMLIR